MDLIDRQAAIDALKPCAGVGNRALDKLRALPSVEPKRKTGRWIVITVNTFEMAYGSTGYEPVYECSLCGGVEESYLRFDEPIMPEDANFPNYCPHCGAKMEETNETN